MALILAIEPDRRQAAQLTSLIRARVGADLVLAETAEQALNAIGDRVPDLVLVPALLAPQDDATLAGALRVIAAAARIQMLTIPVLAATSRKKQPRGVLAKWRRLRGESPASGGCDPSMFGDQIAAYLAEAAAERAVNESDRAASAPAALPCLAEVPGRAAAPAEVSIDKTPVIPADAAPLGEAVGIDGPEIGRTAIEIGSIALEAGAAAMEIGSTTLEAGPAASDIESTALAAGPDAIEIGSTAIEVGPVATVEAVAAEAVAQPEAEAVAQPEDAGSAQTGLSLGVPDDPPAEELSVHEPQEAVAVTTASIAGVVVPQANGDVGPWVPLSFVPREDLPIVEPSIAPDGFANVEAAGDDLPMAVDAISLSTQEETWDTAGQTEFFLSAFHGEELSIEEPAVYELQTDDLLMDALSFDEPPIDTPLCQSPAIETVTLDQPISPGTVEPWIAPHTWPSLDGIDAQEIAAKPLVTETREKETPLSSFTRRIWPDLEGMVVEALPGILATVVVEPPMAAAKTVVVAASAPAAKPEWLELIESLRRDVERLRGESTRPPSVATAVRHKETARTTTPIVDVAEPLPSPRSPSVLDTVTRTRKRPGLAKPAQDEWGFFDPDQCGFAALLAKLDEITHLNDGA
jgi:hypothetical protein